MRIVVLVLAGLGALGAAAGAALWYQAGEVKVAEHTARLKNAYVPENLRAESRAQLPVLVTMPYFLGAGLLLGSLALVLALSYRNYSAAALLLLAAVGPLAIAAQGWDWIRASMDTAALVVGPCLALLLASATAVLAPPRPAPALEGPSVEDEEEPDEEDEEEED